VPGESNGQLNATGTAIFKGFNPINPHRGDAIVASFFWVGSTNIITSVSDHLTVSPGTRLGNTYTLVEYVTAGGISMATYVATNVQNFPDAYDERVTPGDSILVVQADLSSPITVGGMMISSYSGVIPTVSYALGGHSSASGSGTSTTTAHPGATPAQAGALVYGVTLADAVVGVEPPPPPFASVQNASNATLKADAEYLIQGGAGSVDPQWVWFFDSPSAPRTWLATVLALNPAATQLAFQVQPSKTLPFAKITPAVRVAAVDDQGNTVTSFSGSVTIAIGRDGGLLLPGTLSGTRTVPFVNGVATFADLSIDQLGNGYTLRATASGLRDAESAAFNISVF